MFEVLERWAADEFRSVNGQVEYLLMDAARKAGKLKLKNSKESTNPPEDDDSTTG